MLTFKNYLNEVLKLSTKLGSSNPNVEKFLDDLHNTTDPHPFNPKVRLVNGNVGVHVSKSGDGIHIHDILSYQPKSGAGTAALKHLTALADKHKVPLEGVAKAYTSEGGRIGSSPRLKKWYVKHGFTASGSNIRYEPK